MADLDKIIKDIENLRTKVTPELEHLDKMYNTLKEEINDKFQEERRAQNGDLKGLEDFYSLLITIKRDTNVIRNVNGLFKRLNRLSDYKVSEEMIEESELSEIFQKN